MRTLRVPMGVLPMIRCPRCAAELDWAESEASCRNLKCGMRYPVCDGVPILIDETKSIFAIADFMSGRETTFRSSDRMLKNLFSGVMPRIGHNVNATRNFLRFGELLLEEASSPRVLVVGGSVVGKGMDQLTRNRAIELVETDVAISPRTALICDAHDLPFVDSSFDGVIAQAVLEHVLDPQRCVAEIHRVLKPRGLVYGETPFMQQVHMGPYDFTRFSHLGHRRLFRHFEEIDSGAANGPGMALAWAWQYFLLSFTAKRLPRALLRGFAALTAFPLKYFDYLLIDRPGALDAASGIYFLGRKSPDVLSDKELVQGYRGAM